MIVKGTVLTQGVSGKPNTGEASLACSVVKIIPPIVPSVFTKDALIDNFEFDLTGPPDGTYTIHAEYSGYLASETTITINAGGPTIIDVGTTKLCGGDVKGDGVINILDIGTIIGKFGSAGVPVGSSDPTNCNKPDEPADINDDSLVNISDLAIAAGNWTHTGPTPWRTDQCDP